MRLLIDHCPETTGTPNLGPQAGHRPWVAIAALVAGLLPLSPAQADVFMHTGPDGTPVFSDRRTDPAMQRVLRTDGAADPPPAVAVPNASAQSRPQLDRAISAAAQSNRVDPLLLHALVAVESGYNTRAVSPKGASGLTQLMPATARQYGVSDSFDVVQNLDAGARLLRDLLDRFSDNTHLALAAYNAGAGAVIAHGNRIPPYAETRRYVPEVLRRYALLREQVR